MQAFEKNNNRYLKKKQSHLFLNGCLIGGHFKSIKVQYLIEFPFKRKACQVCRVGYGRGMACHGRGMAW